MNNYTLKCPHCKIIIDFSKYVNNKYEYIQFRHGKHIDTLKPIDKCLSDTDCLNLVKNNKIIGCGKICTLSFHNNKFNIY